MGRMQRQRVPVLADELIVDLFAGGGGASLGIADACREPDVAVNHDPIAVAVHRMNHPGTRHYQCDVFEVDPVEATAGRPVGLLWASPDCRHHSKAKGGKPRSKKIRALAWVVVKWAALVKPRCICLENVEEFADWGPLLPDGHPCPLRKGLTFRRWKRELERLGYVVEHRELIAADYGSPTIRKRLFVIARCDGRSIVWPRPTHRRDGTGGLPRWKPAAECIDWSIKGCSIFTRPKPLAANTLRRIAKGMWRYVLATPEPFIVPLRGTSAAHHSVHGTRSPLSTISGQGTHHALVQPIAAHLTAFGQNAKGFDPRDPMQVVLAGATRYGVVAAFIEQANGGFYDGDGRDVRVPLSTVTGKGSQQRLVTAYLVKYYRDGGQWQGVDEPMHTVSTKARMGLVETIQISAGALSPEQLTGARRVARFLHEQLPEQFPEVVDVVLIGDYAIVDISLRMLTPRELARAQGFPDSYIIEQGNFTAQAGDRPDLHAVTKTSQVRLIGNSVCPQVAEALIAANVPDIIARVAQSA